MTVPRGRPKKTPGLLTAPQLRFIEEYLIDGNATAAMRRSGYRGRDPKRAGHRFLQMPSVKAELAKRREVIADRYAVSADRIVRELATIAFANMQDYMEAGPDGDPHLSFADLTREQAGALAEMTVEDFVDGRGEDARDVRRVKFKLHDKLAALAHLGKHLGLFRDKVEVTGPEGGPVRMEITDRERAKALAVLIQKARSAGGNSD